MELVARRLGVHWCWEEGRWLKDVGEVFALASHSDSFLTHSGLLHSAPLLIGDRWVKSYFLIPNHPPFLLLPELLPADPDPFLGAFSLVLCRKLWYEVAWAQQDPAVLLMTLCPPRKAYVHWQGCCCANGPEASQRWHRNYVAIPELILLYFVLFVSNEVHDILGQIQGKWRHTRQVSGEKRTLLLQILPGIWSFKSPGFVSRAEPMLYKFSTVLFLFPKYFALGIHSIQFLCPFISFPPL